MYIVYVPCKRRGDLYVRKNVSTHTTHIRQVIFFKLIFMIRTVYCFTINFEKEVKNIFFFTNLTHLSLLKM